MQHDQDWLLCVGVAQIMDKMIEHPEFTGIVSLIRHATFVAREEFGHNNLRTDLDSGSHDPNVSFPRSIRTLSVNDALLDFATMDHASLFRVGKLGYASHATTL